MVPQKQLGCTANSTLRSWTEQMPVFRSTFTHNWPNCLCSLYLRIIIMHTVGGQVKTPFPFTYLIPKTASILLYYRLNQRNVISCPFRYFFIFGWSRVLLHSGPGWPKFHLSQPPKHWNYRCVPGDLAVICHTGHRTVLKQPRGMVEKKNPGDTSQYYGKALDVVAHTQSQYSRNWGRVGSFGTASTTQRAQGQLYYIARITYRLVHNWATTVFK